MIKGERLIVELEAPRLSQGNSIVGRMFNQHMVKLMKRNRQVFTGKDSEVVGVNVDVKTIVLQESLETREQRRDREYTEWIRAFRRTQVYPISRSVTYGD